MSKNILVMSDALSTYTVLTPTTRGYSLVGTSILKVLKKVPLEIRTVSWKNLTGGALVLPNRHVKKFANHRYDGVISREKDCLTVRRFDGQTVGQKKFR